MKCLLALVLAMGACATGPSFYANPPPPMTPAQVMADRACGPVVVQHSPNVNMTAGWVTKRPASMEELSCGNKYLPSIYCSSRASCPNTLSWGINTPPSMSAGSIHWIVDVLRGSISVAAQQTQRFGVGSLAAKRTTCEAAGGMPKRCVLPVQVVGQAQMQGPTEVIIDALSDGVVIGAIATAETLD